MKALIFFLMVLSCTPVLSQYPQFYSDRKDLESDTTRVRVLIGLGGIAGGERKNLGSPLKKTLNVGKDKTFFRPEMDFLWYFRVKHPKLNPFVFDVSYEAKFSVNEITSIGGIYFGKENFIVGGLAGIVTQKVSGGDNFVRSEIGRYSTQTVFGFRQVSNLGFAESSATFIFSENKLNSEYIFLFKYQSAKVNFYAGGVLSRNLNARFAITTRSGVLFFFDSSFKKDFRFIFAKTL